MKVAVEYVPNQNLESYLQYMSEHLKFISTQMENGHLQSAGPFLQGEDLKGGFSIYNLEDEQKVADLVQNDPFIREKVFSFETHLWMQCALKK